MSALVKTNNMEETTKVKEPSSKKMEENTDEQIRLSNLTMQSSSYSSTEHQQHHSAPPLHNQQAKIGLDAIHENGEYSSKNEQQQNSTNNRFPRSSTVPYPAYATLRTNDVNYISPSQYYYTDNAAFIHGTVSPAQLNTYFNSRQPLSLINNNFQPISPHHHQYSTRPVDILKPTFLIVPKATEQKLAAQLSASNSPILTTNRKIKSTTKKEDTKNQQKTTTAIEQSSPTVRSVEVQTNNESPTRTTMDIGHQHIGLLATPNPSPYVHFVNVTYPIQSTPFSHEGPPETSIIQDEFTNVNDYNHPSASIRSMPNIALTQVSPHHWHGSPILRHYHPSQQPIDEQQQQQQILTSTQSSGVRSATVPQMAKPTNSRTRIETGETDESSVASFDFTHTDLVDMPGSWRYQSVPVRTVVRRHRAPIPQAFLDSQQYVSDSEQVVRSSSYRQQQLFGSIPTINRPFDSIQSQQPIQYFPSIRLNEKDVLKIASFYKSIGTLVYVAHSIATLYTSDFDAMANLKDWKKLYTGVPIWLFNTGMNPKRARCIRLVISELGSSFTLWDTIVNGASDVRLPKSRHITLKSLETGTILALKFDDANATDEFHQYFVKLSCDPRNADLFDVFNAKRRRPVFILHKRKIKKSAISKPSHFNHITKVDEHDRDSLYTYSVLVDDGTILS
ncbi:unnamed protein product [Rotaria sp. Silwood2]|nr:unnamed protein product [Rotaria sp. Silwood2]CAF2515314.1 unnamed protein product [Rotaria sp. Silwood2]CAF2749795.1 unnamed protein product [Rotaria sp. Silwood2]CAF3052713.1 unnamed protein product [Rotaria sp. Silwood2]CAF3940754.1 unnamed protein product [Rotaria sp. Silwood2]